MTTLLRKRGKQLLNTRLLLSILLAIIFTPKLHAQAIIEHSKVFTSTSVGGVTETRALITEGAYSYLLVTTFGNSLPITVGSAPTTTTNKSALIKLDTAGHIIWARYLPLGTLATTYGKMKLNNGIIYLLGSTTATDVPVTNGSTAGGGGSDILFSKVDAGTGSIVHNGYLGGNGAESTGLGLAVENSNVFITYTTQSSNVFTSTGPAYTSGYDHVVQKLGASGNILYSTYTGSVAATALNTDSVSLAVENGNAYLGLTVSSTNTFTTTNGSTVKGLYDYGIVRLDASGNRSFAAVIGGTGTENRPVLQVDNGDMYLAGISGSANFPTTNGSLKTSAPTDLTVTRLNSSGATVYSGYYAGLTSVGITLYPEAPIMQIESGALYISGGTYGSGSPVVTATDGSSGKYYLLKLNPVSGTVLFSRLFGPGSIVVGGRQGAGMFVKDGMVSVVTSVLNASGAYTTDGSTKTSQSGTFVATYTTAGQLIFASFLMGNNSGSFGGFYKPATSDGKMYVAGAAATSGFPVTEAIQGTISVVDITWTAYSFCPPMPTVNTITPLSQTVCREGFTQPLTGNEVLYPSSQMPLLYINSSPKQQNEIRARYQWQVATAAGGPWVNASGISTQRDYTPPTGTQNRYYRRLVLPPVACGDVPVSTSVAAEVLVGANTAPVVTGGIFNTCAGTAVTISATASGGTTPYTYAWDNGITGITNTAVVTPAANSVYTLTVTDANGCQQVGQAIVNAYQADAGLSAISSCAGSPVRIGTAPPAGLAGVTYSWTPTTGLDNPAIAQPLATPASTTVYTVQMTVPVSGGGTCTTSDNITVNVIAAPATPNFAGADQASCKGGTLNLGTTAEAGFTYTWSPGNYLTTTSGSTTTFDAGTDLPQPDPFTYTLTANSNGCSFTDNVTVSVLAVDAGIDYCGPRTVGTPDKTPGVTGKTYLWEVLSGTGTITGATNTATTTVSASVGVSTSYRVTVSYLGASCMDTVIVDAVCGGSGCPILNIAVTAPHSCPSTALGPVTLSVVPANLLPAQWTYSWSAVPAGGLSATTGTSVNLTDNVERDVTVTITRADNPAWTCSKTIHVNGPSWAIPAFNSPDRFICPTSAIAIGDPVAGYNYLWENVNQGDEHLDNPSVSPVITTSYPVLVTDAVSGCTLNDTVKVTVNPLVNNPGPDWVICSNALVTLGSPALPGYTYSWSPQVANYQNGTTYQSAEPQVLVAATQSFTLTSTDTQTGCTKDSTVVITIDNNPALPAMPNITICPGSSDTIGLPALTGVTYSWVPATGLSSTTVAQPIASPAATQTYTLTVTYYDAGGAPSCTKSGSVTVTVNAPQVTMSDDAICPSGPLYNLSTGVNPTGAMSYAWTPAILVTNPSLLGTTVKVNPGSPTTFTLTITDANGCTATASKVVSPLNPAPEAGSAAFLCVGSSRTLGASSNTGTLNWTVTPAMAGTLTPVNGAEPVFTPAAGDANKTFTFIITQDIGGCINTDSVKIQVKNLVLPPMTAQTVCTNSNATIGVPAQPNISYSWTPVTGLTNPNAATTTVNNVTANSIYTLTATDAFGCAASATATVGVNPAPAPAVTIPAVTIAVGSPGVPFSPQVIPMPANYTYTWTPANQVNNPYIPNATGTPGAVGDYVFNLTVTNDNGCSITAPVTLHVVPFSVVPVILSSFNAGTRTCGVQLNWTIEAPENFSRFVVERSDGINFRAVGTVFYEQAKNQYHFDDVDPGNGKWLYRLKLIDVDGNFRYSPYIRASINCLAKETLLVYPNPLNDKLYIKSSKPVKSVILISATGAVILKKEYTQQEPGILLLPVENNIAKGIYILTVRATDGTIQSSKLVKE
jgi:hypothetical protein